MVNDPVRGRAVAERRHLVRRGKRLICRNSTASRTRVEKDAMSNLVIVAASR